MLPDFNGHPASAYRVPPAGAPRFRWRLAAFGGFVALLCAGAVRAEEPEVLCLPIDAMPEFLSEQYGELPIGGGITADGVTAGALYADPQDGSWSFVVAGRDACIAAAGDRWLSVFEMGGPA